MKTTKMAALVFIPIVLAAAVYLGKQDVDIVKLGLKDSQAETIPAPGLTDPGAAPEELRGEKLSDAQVDALAEAAERTCAGLQYFEGVVDLIDNMTESEFQSVMKKLNSFKGPRC